VVRPEVKATPMTRNVYGYLVNGVRGRDVEHVFVDGVQIIDGRRFTRLDKERAEERILKTVERLWSRLGEEPGEAVEPLRLM
ncbi:MAG: hypothetical protein QXJ09_06250, partial [Candidatus Caldarchaeum sp.]